MKTSNVPGYKELYPNGNELYSDLVKDISSEMIIRVCGALNNELNGKGGVAGNQAGILKDFSNTFTIDERRELSASIAAYRSKIGEETRLIFFGTRYLVSMVIKELNHFRTIDHKLDDKPVEYQLFKAYLLIIDEEAEKDHKAIDFKKLLPGDPLNLMRVLILPIINQFEFNERSDMLFETYKTACFFKYLQNSSYRPYLKEWLNGLHFKNVGAYLASFKQINLTIHNMDPNAKMLKRLNYIKPDGGVDQTHLQRLSVNLQVKDKFTLTELKKAPLVYAEDRESYMVVDHNGNDVDNRKDMCCWSVHQDEAQETKRKSLFKIVLTQELPACLDLRNYPECGNAGKTSAHPCEKRTWVSIKDHIHRKWCARSCAGKGGIYHWKRLELSCRPRKKSLN